MREGLRERGERNYSLGMVDSYPKPSEPLTLRFYFNQLFGWYLLLCHLVCHFGTIGTVKEAVCMEGIEGRLNLKFSVSKFGLGGCIILS